MRNRWDHTEPDAIQERPEDNTSKFIDEQVAAWQATGVLVHVETAMEIAAWWQSPGTDGIDFARFQGSGTITARLLPAIDRELPACAEHRAHLESLRAYVVAAIDEVGGQFCERCDVLTSEDEIDDDFGLCPKCCAYNASRVVL